MNKKPSKLIGIISIKAKVKNTSPMLIASGNEENADKEIIKRSDGKPYIPGSSLAGKLLCLFKERQTEFKETDECFKQFWGGDFEENQYQSHINIEDATLCSSDTHLAVRDGVAIDAKTNMAIKGAKYDYEVLEPGHTFDFYAEIKIRESFEAFVLMASNFLAMLDKIQIGANAKTGLGNLEFSDVKAHHFDFSIKQEQQNWFDFLDENFEIAASNLPTPLELKKESNFIINAIFGLKSTLLTATTSNTIKGPDKTQLYRRNSNNVEHILSGASIRGAIKHRALKILNAQSSKDSQAIVNQIFGYVQSTSENENGVKNSPIKSRLIVEESVFKKSKLVNQTRIKIDRFTGGTINSALMEEQPITTCQDQEINLLIKLKDYTQAEANLLLYVFKDLWTGDLAIGGGKNIGRGILLGKSAKISFCEKEFTLSASGMDLNELKELKELMTTP